MLDASVKRALRKDLAGAEVIASWRRLTGGRAVRDGERRTLVAVSGGCDSSALLLALASATENLVVGHVVHDFRPPAEALADRDAVAGLAARAGLPFVQGTAPARLAGGNLEAAARRLRYAELARLAGENQCGFIATAHHADDLLETVLMRLLRGTGPAGLAPIRDRRPLANTILVRPMLGVTRSDSERLCGLAGHSWSIDSTNADVSRLRNDLRATIVPELKRLSPLVAQKVAVTSQLVGEAAQLVRARARWLIARGTHDGQHSSWDRSSLRTERAVVLGELLRLSVRTMTGGEGMDLLSHRVLAGAVRAIRDDSTDPREFVWGRVAVHVRAGEVWVGQANRS